MAEFYINAKVKLDTKSVQEQLNKVTSKASKSMPKIDTKQSTAAVGGLISNVKSLGSQFVETTKKVAEFGLSTSAISLFTNGVQSAVTTVKEFDDAVTELKKVSDLSGDSLDSYTQKLGEMGTTVARTRTEMTEAATEFKKGGYSDEDAATLAKTASLYQNIADEELSASDASAVLISQMKAFNIQAQDSTHIIDAINEV
nr:MAG TPA: minor tail protein [Caudoviricetes sp.]